MTRTILQSSKTLLSIAAVALTCASAKAASFASAVTNKSGTIQFILNQTADANGVYVLFDNNTVSNLLVGQTNVGSNSFILGSHTNFTIHVTTTGNGTPVQISSDTGNSIESSLRGIASQWNPTIGYQFGRIYFGNSTDTTAAKGIYMLNADESTPAQGKGPFTGGVWSQASTSSPYRMTVNDDGTLYVGDFSTAAATVWQFDPNLTQFTNQILAIVGENQGLAAGTHGDIEGSPVPFGSSSNGNLVVFTADPSLAAGTAATNGSGGSKETLGFRTSPGTYNNVYRYTIGTNSLPYTNAPDLAIGLGLGGIPELVIDVAVHRQSGNIYAIFERFNYAAPCLQVFDSTGQNRLFTSIPDSLINIGPDPFNLVAPGAGSGTNAPYAISISPDGKYMGIGMLDNQIYVCNITNGVPDISSLVVIPNPSNVGNLRGICWDAADNVYTASSGQGLIRLWSLGNSSTTVTGNDSTGTNGTFQLILPPITASVVATTPLASQNFGTPTPGIFTITLNTNALAAPLVVNYVLAGTATNGTYISSATNTVTFPAGTNSSGNLSTNITITPTAVPVTGPVITVTLQVTGGAAYLGASPLIDTVTINNTGPDSFSITPVPSPTITTDGGATNATLYRGITNDFAPFLITRLGNTASTVTLTNFSYTGTAHFGTDYKAGVQSGISPVNGASSVTFGPGDITKQVIIGNPVPTPFGAAAPGDETIIVTIAGTNSQEGVLYSVTGSPGTFTLLDNSFGTEQVLWSDSMNSPTNSTNYTLTFASTNLGATTVLPVVITNYNNSSPGAATNNYSSDGNGTNDFNVVFGYPAASDSIAPSLAMAAKGWTNVLKMTVNKDPNFQAPSGVNVYPQGVKFYGNYALRFNMMLVEGTFTGTFSAEFAAFGIDHYGTNCNWVPGATITKGSGTTNEDGSWAAVGADQGAATGGTPADLALYNGAKVLPNTGYNETVSAVEQTFSNVFRHPAPFTATGIGSPANLGGKAVNTWVDVEMKQYQGTATLSMDKSVVLSFPIASTNIFTNGTIMLGYFDPFYTVSDVGAVYYSNVRVVELAPAVTNGPTPVVINPGGTATFTIGAVGTAPFTNQLYASSNGVVAIGSPVVVSTPNDTATFVVPGITAANSTNYYVVVSDSAGSITSSVVAITVVTPPANITTNDDVNVSFTPIFNGPTTGLLYQWSTNGVNVTNSTHLAGVTTSTLTLTNVQLTDIGTYTIVVSNTFGYSTTNSATLTVIIPTSPSFTSVSYNQTNATLQWSSKDIYDLTNSFILESTTNLLGAWITNTATVTVSNGTNFQVILPQTNAYEFYRLLHK